jgi:hypothetical protein
MSPSTVNLLIRIALRFIEWCRKKEKTVEIIQEEPKLEVVFVEWRDAASGSRWIPKGDDEPFTVTCQSIGYVIRETEDEIVLTSTIGSQGDTEEEEYAGYFAIPKGCIKHRWTINIE